VWGWTKALTDLRDSFTKWIAYFEQRLSTTNGRLDKLEQKVSKMASQADLDALKAAFVDYKTSSAAVISALQAKIAATAADDTAAIQALTAEVQADKTELPVVQ